MKIFKYMNAGLALCLFIAFISCRKNLDVDLSKSQISSDLVFGDDITATMAVTGIYYNFMDLQSFASGSYNSVVALTGMSSDELNSHFTDLNYSAFQQNTLLPDNSNVMKLWASMYKAIYSANAVLEGLSRSTGVSAATKKQLEGEAQFIRAFSNFYLVNLFGDIPLITTTDYKVNRIAHRTSISEVYEAIINDLKAAQNNLNELYISGEKVRPNKSTATALLARVYLYSGEWAKAEIEATSIINDPNYQLSPLGNVFLKNSDEAIWQLMPVDPSLNTYEGNYFILVGTPRRNSLTLQLVNAFEAGDNRRTEWTKTRTSGGTTFYYPFKYRVRTGGTPLNEYSMVFRLSEQYLIRAEAKIELNDFIGAQNDINIIRNKSGLPNTTAINKPLLLSALEQERRIELFAEWGHRWFDLKRWKKTTVVLAPLKSGWNSEDVLYPLPLSEMQKNPNLKPQNPGY